MSVLKAIGGCEYTLGILPGYVFVSTDDTYDAIQAVGYLNDVTITGVGFVPWSPGFTHGQFVFVSTTDKLDVIMRVIIDSSSNISLIPALPLQERVFLTPNFLDVTTPNQISTTRDANVTYSFDGSVTTSTSEGQSIKATLQYADDSTMSTNVVIVDNSVTSNSGILGLTQVNALSLQGVIPAGKYRQVIFETLGGASAPSSLVSAQEVLL